VSISIPQEKNGTATCSIVIPTRNPSKTIKHCLNSVQEQSYKNTETIIVDSKSSDDTASISERMGCKVIFTKWKTLGARYIGFKVSAGNFILMLDSDQILEKSAVERCVRLLQEQKYDMLCLEEMAYTSKTFLEKLYQADRRLVIMKLIFKSTHWMGVCRQDFTIEIFSKMHTKTYQRHFIHLFYYPKIPYSTMKHGSIQQMLEWSQKQYTI